MDASYETGHTTVTIGSRERHVPGRVRDCLEWGRLLVVSITPADHYGVDLSDAVEAATVELPSPSRNLVAFDESSEVVWIVDEPRHSTRGDHFRDLYEVTGRLLATDRDDHLYEVDPSTGAVLDDWSEAELPVGDSVVSFESSIWNFFQLDDLVVVQARAPPSRVRGFETDGSIRWRQERRSHVERRGDTLVETIVPNDSKRATVRIDPGTGKRVAVLESDLSDPEQYLDTSGR